MSNTEIIIRFILIIITFGLPFITVMLDALDTNTEFQQCQRKRRENPDDF